MSSAFSDFELIDVIQKAIAEKGYTTPSPIQSQTIPLILQGQDVLGQAATGSGKTAAFGLPILSGLDLAASHPQSIILAPTRELALQVSSALKEYGQQMAGLTVVPIYGGQSYDTQIKALKRRAHIIVGTPGRVMDLIEKKHLDISHVKTVVLDEADEMLDMGFVDDIEWILQHAPEKRQTILFSATMPSKIKKIASKYLHNPEVIRIEGKMQPASTITQQAIQLRSDQKLKALTRVLATQTYDGVIIFVKTKLMASKLNDILNQSGHQCVTLSGEIQQKLREQTVRKFKDGQYNILVATDVAARGLDIDRIDLVINFDMPHNVATYIHRIGRTGRAGRHGTALALVTRKENFLLRDIQRQTQQPVEVRPIPSVEAVKAKAQEALKLQLTQAASGNAYQEYLKVIEDYCVENNMSPTQAAAVLASLVCKVDTTEFSESFETERPERAPRQRLDKPFKKGGKRPHRFDGKLKAYKINVGKSHGVTPRNIVGAIANEANISSKYLGAIKIYHDHSTIDMPGDLPKETLQVLSKTWIAGQQLKISRMS